MFAKHAKWLYPLIALLILAPFTSEIDMATSSLFYEGNNRFMANGVTDAFFNFGVVPAQITAIVAALLYLVSYFKKSLKKWRNPCLVLVLTMLIGEGLIVHAVLKDNWGRPRPKQVIEFGGRQEFRPFYKPNFFNQPEPSKSFVCGHCGMGYFFLAFMVLGWRYRNRLLWWFGLVFGLTLGTVMGLVRIAQGGHFVTDVLWAGLIIWWTALAADYLIYGNENGYERFN